MKVKSNRDKGMDEYLSRFLRYQSARDPLSKIVFLAIESALLLMYPVRDICVDGWVQAEI